MCPTHVIGHVCPATAESPLRGLAALAGVGIQRNPPRFERPLPRSQRHPAADVAPPGTKEALNPHSCRAAANASGFLQVSLSKTPRHRQHAVARSATAEPFPIKASDNTSEWLLAQAAALQVLGAATKSGHSISRYSVCGCATRWLARKHRPGGEPSLHRRGDQ
jgi:hypothetical protein